MVICFSSFHMIFFQTKASKDGRSPSIWDAFCALPGKIQNGDTGPGTSSWWEGSRWELFTDSVRHILDSSVRCTCWFCLIILSSNFWQGQGLGYLCVFNVLIWFTYVSNCDTLMKPILSGLPGNNACEHYYSPLVVKDFWPHDSVTYHSVTEDLQKMWSWWRTGQPPTVFVRDMPHETFWDTFPALAFWGQFISAHFLMAPCPV